VWARFSSILEEMNNKSIPMNAASTK
jgi:hypothetical protein